MDLKKVYFLLGIAVSVIIFLTTTIVFLLLKDDKTPTDYYFNKAEITYKDVKKSHKNKQYNINPDSYEEPQKKSDKTANDASPSPTEELKPFYDNIINDSTRGYFSFLESLFPKSATMDDHLLKIKDYLFSKFPDDIAQNFYETYENYLITEMDLVQELQTWAQPSNYEELIAQLKRMHEFRRNSLGEEIADKIFGPEVKENEYNIRKNAILKDDSLYAEEKEEQLKTLAKDMWKEDYDLVLYDQNSYDKYQEKMTIYKKDLEEISPEEKNQKIKELREKCFSPEQVERLESVDREIEQKKSSIESYRQAENQILNDSDLTEAEKQSKLIIIQNKTFGDDADAFRRKEIMKKEMEKRRKKYSK